MSLSLPRILHDDKYNGMWHFENGWPVSEENAPQELKDELRKFREENQPPIISEDGKIIMV